MGFCESYLEDMAESSLQCTTKVAFSPFSSTELFK